MTKTKMTKTKMVTKMARKCVICGKKFKRGQSIRYFGDWREDDLNLPPGTFMYALKLTPEEWDTACHIACAEAEDRKFQKVIPEDGFRIGPDTELEK